MPPRAPTLLCRAALPLLVLAPLAHAARAGAAGKKFRVLYNVAYVPHGGRSRTGDLYLPAGKGRRPAVVLVHGGGWVGGNKEMAAGERYLAPRLARAGCVAFNINYRLVGHGGAFPHDLLDVKDAVAFLQAHAARFHVDVRRMAIVGGSAGAHLALMAAYTAGANRFPAPHYPADAQPHLCAVGAFYAPTDLTWAKRLPRRNWVRRLVSRYLRRVAHGRHGYKAASPVTYARFAPPTFLAHGATDALVPLSQAKELMRTLRHLKKPVQLLVVPGVGHAFMDFPCPARRKGCRRLMAFLARRFAAVKQK